MTHNYLSTAQISSLQSIAGQCPLSGGESVFTARDMLVLMQIAPVFYNDDVLCSAAPRSPGNVQTGLGNTISIFPNPANDEITVQYDLQHTGVSQLQFLNIYGQLVKEITLPDAQGKVSMPTGNLAAGVYVYTLNGITSGRLIINH